MVSGKKSSMAVLVFFLICMGGMAVKGRAQTATVQGIITDASNGQTLEDANIFLQKISAETSHGAATDHNGYYHIELEAGDYALRISFVGYVTYRDTLTFRAGESTTVSVALEQSEELMNQLVISAHEGAGKLEAGRQHVTAVDLGRVPTPAGGGDLASYLQSLPGVVATGDRGGQLYVRGGTPSQNLSLIDGNLVWQPFHILGYFSVFPQDLISGVDFYAGGFGPRYSGRISSVLDVKMRDGDPNNVKGSVSISPFVGQVVGEGPINKGKSSWIGSIQRSFIEGTSPLILGEKQPLRFGSQYFKVTHFGSNNSGCSMMGLHTYDRGQLDVRENDTFRWGNFVLGGRCVALSDDPDLLFDMNIGLSRVWNDAGSEDVPRRSSYATLTNVDFNITKFLGEVRLEYGLFVHVNFVKYDMNELFGGPHTGDENFMTLGGSFEPTIPLGKKVEIKPGAVVYFSEAEHKIDVEPRFRMSWQPWGREREELNVAAGLYYQQLTGVTDKSGAGSVFQAWMPIPLDKSRMEALHALLGWHQSLGGGFNASIEGYYKKIRNIPVPVWSTTTRFVTDLVSADGTIYGADLRLEFRRNPFYGFLGYGYSNTEYETTQELFKTWYGEATERYHPAFDRRHQVNAQLNVQLGAYTVGLRWEFGSGLPFTSPYGFDEVLSFTEKLPNVRNEFGTTRVLLDKLYTKRMPPFHRLDVSMKRSFQFKFGELELQAGAINMYDRANLFYYDVYTQRRLDQLPIAPYVSMKVQTE